MTTRKNFKIRIESRHVGAAERHEFWRALTFEKQLEAIDLRLGEGVGAVKQRARIAEAIVERDTPKVEPAKKGKKRRRKEKKV